MWRQDQEVYVYDGYGQLDEETRDNSTTNYAFDSSYNLTTFGSNSLSYSSNQLTAVNTTERQFSYNAQGARTLDDRSGTTNDYEWEYDPFGNLTQVKKGRTAIRQGLFMTGRSARHPELVEGPPVNSPAYTADYDAFGRRFRWSDGTNTSYFLYDGSVPFAEFNASGTLQRRIFWGPTGPICLRQSSNRWFIADKFGNTRALVSDGGTITDYYAYDAWGNPVSAKSSGSSYNPFRWNGSSGYQYVNQTALYHVGAREYDPSVGRWLQRDPIAMSGGWPNLYGYCANDPVECKDPSGKRELVSGPGTYGWVPVFFGLWAYVHFDYYGNVDQLLNLGANQDTGGVEASGDTGRAGSGEMEDLAQLGTTYLGFGGTDVVSATIDHLAKGLGGITVVIDAGLAVKDYNDTKEKLIRATTPKFDSGETGIDQDIQDEYNELFPGMRRHIKFPKPRPRR